MDFWDLAGKMLVILAGSGIGVKFVFDWKSSRNGKAPNGALPPEKPVTHKELYDHALGCSSVVMRKIEESKDQIMAKVGEVSDRVARLEGPIR